MQNRYTVRRTQAVTLTGTSAQSDAIGDDIYSVRLAVKGGSGAHVAFGADPTATATTTFIPTNADAGIVFAVQPGQLIAGIQGGTGGVLLIDELT